MTGQPKNEAEASKPETEAGTKQNTIEASETAPDELDNEGTTNYTAAQLRMARRKARRLGLNPKTGKQAIRLLNERGIPIDDATPSGTPNTAPAGTAAPPSSAPLASAQPSTQNALMQAKKGANLPAAQVLGQNDQLPVISKEDRQLEIAKLEKKIRQRRETRMRRLMRRFSLFVFLPTILTAIYYYFIATPLYEANTVLNIENATSRATGGLGDLMKNTPFGGGGEFTAVQDYLLSRSAFDRLQTDYPFVELYEGDNVDRFLRIDEEANKEEQYKLYRRQVKVKFDNTDQKLVMDVRSPDAQSALDVSELLLKYAEERVDDKTQRVRDTGVEDAEKLLEEKTEDLLRAEEEIARISEENKTLGAGTEQAELQALVAQYRAQLTENQVALQQLEANPNPNQIRIRGLRSQIEVLEKTISDLTQQGLEENEQGTSVTRLAQEMRIAETRLAMATNQFEQATINLQSAEAEARSQRMFVTPTLPPTASYEPVYPQKLLSTFSAFIIFFALYILISITVEVIREQVSA